MAQGDTQADLLSRLYIIQGRPDTTNLAGFDALGEFTRITGVIDVPEFGDTAEAISEGTIDEGRAEQFWGQVTGAAIDVPLKYIEGDPGQTMLRERTVADLNTTYSIRIERPNGMHIFAYGRLNLLRVRNMTTTSMSGWIQPIAFNSPPVYRMPGAGA